MVETPLIEILTKSQVAKWFQVSERSIENWVKNGFPAFWQGHSIRFIREDILKYIREKQEN